MYQKHPLAGMLLRNFSRSAVLGFNWVCCLCALLYTYHYHFSLYQQEVTNEASYKELLAEELGTSVSNSLQSYLQAKQVQSQLITQIIASRGIYQPGDDALVLNQILKDELDIAGIEIVTIADKSGRFDKISPHFSRFEQQLRTSLNNNSDTAALQERGVAWDVLLDPGATTRGVRLFNFTSLPLSTAEQAILITAYVHGLTVNPTLLKPANHVFLNDREGNAIEINDEGMDYRHLYFLEPGDQLPPDAAEAPIVFNRERYQDVPFWGSSEYPGQKYFRHTEPSSVPGWDVVVLLEGTASLDKIQGQIERGLFSYLLILLLFIYFDRAIRLHYQVRALTYTDTLTNLLNRNHLNEFGPDVWALHNRGKVKYVGLIAIDIDHFKQVNDTYGHQVGDKVLQGLANIAMTTCRKNDKVYRLGGEEFAVLTVGDGLDGMLILAERLRINVQNNADIRQFLPRGITISLGVTLRNQHEDEKSFFKRADVLLYRAKANGRNRVEHDEGNTEVEFPVTG